MPHFIISSNSISKGIIRIYEKELFHHLAKVLRIKTGEKLLFIDENEIQYTTEVQEITSKDICVQIINSYKSERKLDLNLYLAQSVLKPDAQFNVIQKATELGVKGILPIYSDNCTIKQSVINEKIDKWQKIALESVKQCERADIPKVFTLRQFKDIIKSNEFDIILAFVEKEATHTLNSFLKTRKIKKDESILAIIGPEGGFSDEEFNLLEEYNIPKITLGNLIYRADTAVIAALSNIIYGTNNE